MPQEQRPGWWWEFRLSLVTHWSFALFFFIYFDRTESFAAFATLLETMTGLMMNQDDRFAVAGRREAANCSRAVEILRPIRGGSQNWQHRTTLWHVRARQFVELLLTKQAVGLSEIFSRRVSHGNRVTDFVTAR